MLAVFVTFLKKCSITIGALLLMENSYSRPEQLIKTKTSKKYGESNVKEGTDISHRLNSIV